MSDTAATDIRSVTANATAQRRSDSGDKLTANSLTAAGAGAFLLWIFGMIDAGHFYVPPVETAMFMGAAILPIASALGKRWIKEIERGPYIGGVNAGPAKNSNQELANEPATQAV